MCAWGFPDSSVGKESACNAGDKGDISLIPGLGRSRGEGTANPLLFLPEKSHGERSLVGYSPVDCKELDMTEQLNMHTHVLCRVQ